MDHSQESTEHTQLRGSGASSYRSVCQIEYDASGEGFMKMGGVVVPIRVFTNATAANVDMYRENSANLTCSDYFLTCIASWKDNHIATEQYKQTLGDILKYSKGSNFWKNSLHGTRMGPDLQNIFCDIISGLEILNKNQCNFDIDVGRVVFLEDKTDLEKGVKPNAKLVYIWSEEGNTPESYKSARLWQQLGELVENVVSLAKVQPHPEITAFCTLLKNHCRGNVAQVVRRHPALLCEEKKLDVAVEIRQYMRMNTGPTRYYKKQAYQNEFNDWICIVKGDPWVGKLFKRIEDACEKKGCSNLRCNNNTSSLLIFVGNCVMNFHMFEMKTEYELWERFDNLFPELFSFAFEKHVMNCKERRIEDQNFVIEVPGATNGAAI